MTINQLKYFAAVCENERIRKAAEALHISEPSISASIKNLEKEIGFLLFSRDNQRLTLTKNGKEFYKKVSKIVSDFTSLEREIEEKRKSGGFIHIMVQNAMGSYLFYHIIPEFLATNPNIHFDISTSPSMNSVEQLLAGKVELITINKLALCSEQLEFSPILNTHLVGFARKGHRLSGKKNVTWEMLKNERMIFISDRSMTTQLVITKCRAAGFEPLITMYSNRTDLTLRMIEKTNALTFFMDEYINSERAFLENKDAFGQFELAEPLSFSIGIARNRDLQISKSAMQFFEFCKTRFCPE